MLNGSGAQHFFGTRDRFRGRHFLGGLSGGGSFRVIEAHYIYCVLYSCYYYLSSTLDSYRLDSGNWEPLLKG